MGTRARVVLAGGGTGGHLYPALNLADELDASGEVDVMLVGAARGIDAGVLPTRGHAYRLLPVEPLYRRRPWRNARAAVAFWRSLRDVRRLFAEFPPDAVLGTGGYAAAPVLLRAARRGIPVLLQEQNSTPGITSRWFARHAKQVHLGYPEAREHLRMQPDATVTEYGNPIRWMDARPSADAARRALGLGPGPVVLVVGGSQGARALNEAVWACLERVRDGTLPRLPGGAQLYWATGPAHHEAIALRLAESGSPEWVHVVPYIQGMEHALAVASVAVSRAGAMAVAEMCAWGVPMWLVPFPHAAGDHQRKNAEALAAAGAARWCAQDRIEREPALLWEAVGGGSVKTIETTGRANVPGVSGWEWVVDNLGTVPRVALGLGSVAGLGAAHLAAAHYSVMVKELSALFVAGPPVVERLGQKLSKNELGGWEIQLKAGAVDDAVDTEEEAFARARRFLAYLPSSIDELPPRGPQADDPERREPWLIDTIPHDIRKPYKMRAIVEAVVDRGSFFEMAALYGRSIITGFARLDGWPVALMAGDPMFYGGAWAADTCQKVERFVDLAQTFHLPLVYLVDCPGFLIGPEAERTGTIKRGVRAMSAMWQTTVPWCAVIVRSCFGVAGAAHRNGGRFATRYAWPSGRWGSLPLEGGIEAAYRAELDAAPDPAAKLTEIEERLNQLRSPFRSAETFWIEEIIDPRDTRPLLCEFANLAAPRRRPGPSTHAMRP